MTEAADAWLKIPISQLPVLSRAMRFTVVLLSGQSVSVEASTVLELRRAAEEQLQLPIHRLITEDDPTGEMVRLDEIR